jgi:hypothetical protein
MKILSYVHFSSSIIKVINLDMNEIGHTVVGRLGERPFERADSRKRII